MKTFTTAVHLGVLVALLHPCAAIAQTTAGIAGTVRDTTGAVLPGVTVEASSPALIEKVRSVVTDTQGQYKIVDLRPGVYVVTFTLPGFSTFKREGIELSVGFTATANAEMQVGALEETVTVTGASPIVDVQNARTQQVLKSEVLNALPTGSKNTMQLISMTLGATNSSAGRNDVGGDKGELSTGILLHGGRGDDGKVNWDGMNTNVFFGNGGGQMKVYYFNAVAVQEVIVDTGGNQAENETGSANLNLVPKEGSNQLAVYGTANYSSASFSAKGVSDDIVARGVGPQSSVKSIYDYGVGVGGPIKRDKLWFYATNRWWGAENYGTSNYFNKSTNRYVYEPDLTRPAYGVNFFVDTSVRLTWQVSSKHKINQEEHIQHGCSCWQAIGAGATSAPEATTDFNYGPQILSQTTWSYPITSRVLMQAGATFLRQNVSYVNSAALTANRFTGIGTPVFPGPDDFSITELTTGYVWGALPGSVQNYATPPDDSSNYNQRASLSYITGSHAFKTGLQTLQGVYDFNGMQVPNQVTYQFRAGVPAGLVEWAGPFYSKMRIKGLGLYVQDQWTLKKLTMNLGARFDRWEGHTLAFDIPAGPFIAARHVDELDDLPNFKNITPRLGAAYDVFGNGKTAIKAAFGKYVFGQGGGLSQQLAPSVAIVQSVTRTWNDVNTNFAPDCALTNNLANGECGQISNLQFGQPVTNITLLDDARRGWDAREYSYQANVQLQQELRPGLGVAIGYFRTWWGNLTVQQNTAVTPADFTEYCITAPADARLGDASGQQICGFYDINPDKFGRVTRVNRLAKTFGDPGEVYNGVDMSFIARWGKGALLQGGLAVGRETIDYCYANGHPELTPENFPANYPRSAATCKVQSPWWDGMGSQIKLQGVLPLPYDFVVSGTFKNLPGIPLTANQVLGNAQIAASLGRSLSACPATGACTATVTHALLPVASNTGTTVAAEVFDQRLNETDLRLTKIVRLGKSRLQGMLDLYNVFNARTPQAINTTYGAAWLRPTLLLGGRLLKFGAQLDW